MAYAGSALAAVASVDRSNMEPMTSIATLLATPVRSVRFHSGVDRSGGPDACWPWLRATNSSGYGVLRIGDAGRSYTVMAHRAAWMLCHATDVPTGQQVDHMCSRRDCCNPAHLRLATPSQNIRASSKHLAGDAEVVRVGPTTTRTTKSGKTMEIWREYLADGKVRQAGRVL